MRIHFAPFHVDDLIGRIILIFVFVMAQVMIIKNGFIGTWNSGPVGKIYLYIFLPNWIVFSIMWIWSYFVTSWIDAGSVKCALEDLGIDAFSLLENNCDEMNQLNIPEFLKDIPKCPKCGLPKPERTHHCSQCNQCYFRFDHHCPLIGNCIALNNMKAFMLFLFYSSILIILSGLNFFAIAAFNSSNIPIDVIYAFFSIIFGISLIVFGCEYVPRVCINVTTLEEIGGIDPRTYDKGRKENFEQIFGRNCFFWLLPTKPDLQGFTWSGYDCYENNIHNNDQNNLQILPMEEDNL